MESLLFPFSMKEQTMEALLFTFSMKEWTVVVPLSTCGTKERCPHRALLHWESEIWSLHCLLLQWRFVNLSISRSLSLSLHILIYPSTSMYSSLICLSCVSLSREVERQRFTGLHWSSGQWRLFTFSMKECTCGGSSVSPWRSRWCGLCTSLSQWRNGQWRLLSQLR